MQLTNAHAVNLNAALVAFRSNVSHSAAIVHCPARTDKKGGGRAMGKRTAPTYGGNRMNQDALHAHFQGEILSAALLAEPETPRTDDLNLEAMARHALNYLRGNPDPARGYECKFDLGPLGIPVHDPQTVAPNEYGFDPVSIADTDCRMMLQYSRMRQMADAGGPCDVELGVRGRIMGYLRDDGMAWTNPAAWSGSPVEGVWLSKWASAKTMMLLTDDYNQHPDPGARAQARRIFEGLRAIAAWDGERAYYPGGGVPVRDGQVFREGWAEDHSRNYPTIVEPCLVYGQACGDEEAIAFAVAMAEGFLAGSQPGQKEMRIDPETGAFEGHVHLHTHALIGVAHLGVVMDEPRYLDYAQNAFEFIRRHGTDYGWYPEHIPQHQHGAETCVVGDMTSIALWLAHRHPHYFDHAERTLRNYLRRCQFFLTERFVVLFERLHRDKSVAEVEAALQALRQLEGGFVSAPAPDDWVKRDQTLGVAGRYQNGIDMMGCCPPEGMRALWEVWSHAAQARGDCVRVNMCLSRNTEAVRVTAGAPEQGWMRVEPKTRTRYEVRPPAWADRATVALTRNGQPVPVVWGGPGGAYVICDAGKPGETLELHWRVPAFVQCQRMLSVPGQEFDLTVQWEGNEVEAVDPMGKYLPLFEQNV